MLVEGKQMRPIWVAEETGQIQVIDQRRLPHELVVMTLENVDRVIYAMQQDPDIFRTFFEVTNLVQPLGRLFAPHIVARVLGNGTPQAPANTPAVVS